MASRFCLFFCPPACPVGVVGPPLAGPGRAAADSSRSAARSRDRCAVCERARRLRDRQVPSWSLDPANTLRPRRDCAVTAVTVVIAVSAVIAGIALLGPVRAARTAAKEAVPPVTSVPAVTIATLPVRQALIASPCPRPSLTREACGGLVGLRPLGLNSCE
jgi:hypothetical protein